jgi:PPM family protein phosphatase
MYLGFVDKIHGTMTRIQANFQVAALTDVGRVRTGNEDSFGHCLDAGVFVVCDGMGGAAAGEIASRLAVDTLLERMCGAAANGNRKKSLEEAIAAANRVVHAHASGDASLSGMGTTLVAAAIKGSRALIGHVGDSRCYLFRAGRLSRLTHDHSLVDEQVRLGNMTAEEAELSPFKNVITRAIGTQDEVEAEIDEQNLKPGDMLLLCSDGLTREVPEEGIAAILSKAGTTEALCQQLIDAANAAGSHDNVTAILVRAN